MHFQQQTACQKQTSFTQLKKYEVVWLLNEVVASHYKILVKSDNSMASSYGYVVSRYVLSSVGQFK